MYHRYLSPAAWKRIPNTNFLMGWNLNLNFGNFRETSDIVGWTHGLYYGGHFVYLGSDQNSQIRRWNTSFYRIGAAYSVQWRTHRTQITTYIYAEKQTKPIERRKPDISISIFYEWTQKRTEMGLDKMSTDASKQSFLSTERSKILESSPRTATMKNSNFGYKIPHKFNGIKQFW